MVKVTHWYAVDRAINNEVGGTPFLRRPCLLRVLRIKYTASGEFLPCECHRVQ